MTIGSRLRTLRERYNLTQEDVGQKIGVSKATVNRYETGEIDIKRTIAIKLAKVFNTSPAYIMGWTDEIIPTNSDTSSSTLSEDEQKILKNFRILNNLGKSRALEYVEDLTYNEKYTREQFFDEESSGA